MSSGALTKPQMRGLLAKCLQFHLVGAIPASLGVGASYKFGVAEKRKKGICRFLQKLWFHERFWGDEEGWYHSECKVILECKECLWGEFRGRLSLTCIPELWNMSIWAKKKFLLINKQLRNTVEKKWSNLNNFSLHTYTNMPISISACVLYTLYMHICVCTCMCAYILQLEY